MEDKLKTIINHYGVRAQLKYFQSEVFELNEAIISHEVLYQNDCTISQLDFMKEHIAEEIADVTVMLEQFRLYYGISNEDITKIMNQKIDRQLDRIDKE